VSRTRPALWLIAAALLFHAVVVPDLGDVSEGRLTPAYAPYAADVLRWMGR